jgi:hypothetical protein
MYRARAHYRNGSGRLYPAGCACRLSTRTGDASCGGCCMDMISS